VKRSGYTIQAGVEQRLEPPQLRPEAVAGPLRGNVLSGGAPEREAKGSVLAHERDGAGPRRDGVHRLGERHADHGTERVAGAAGPARGLKLGDEPTDLGGVEESYKLGGRAWWYLRTVHGGAISVVQAPGSANCAGAAFSRFRGRSYALHRTEKPALERGK
jgi:hypothetical protein